MKQLKDEMALYLEKKQIDKLVRRLGEEITEEYEGEEVILICPLKGSIHFVADLARGSVRTKVLPRQAAQDRHRRLRAAHRPARARLGKTCRPGQERSA